MRKVGRGEWTNRLFSLAVNILQHVFPRPLRLELLIVLVKLQRRPCVLDRVVCVGLNRRVEDCPGEETERELALPEGEVINVDGVDNLVRRDVDVCGGGRG